MAEGTQDVGGLVSNIKEASDKLVELANNLRQQNINLLKKYERYGINADDELLKDFLEEFYHIYPSDQPNEYFVAVPKFLNFSVGWLSHTTKGYNVFTINQYTQWLGEIPAWLRSEINLPDPLRIQVEGNTMTFDELEEDNIRRLFGDRLAAIGNGTARIKKGSEFDLIAKIIQAGSLPFVPHPVDSADIRPDSGIIKFEGKYAFQKKAWEMFLKFGSLLLCYSTGAGKDIISTYMLDRIKVGDLPNLYVSPNLSVLQQMKEDYFPKYAPRLLKDIESGKLILSTYQGYEKIKNIKFGFTVFSEAHVLPSDSFSRLATISTKYRCGGSASLYREDGRENYILALCGQPIGMNWQETARLLGKKYHDVYVHLVNDEESKFKILGELLNKKRKTLIFVEEIALGEKIADKFGIPFIHGETRPSERLRISKESKVFVASRVFELGISLKDLEHIIEVSGLGGSRRESIQRTGRLMHSEQEAKRHDILFTRDEYYERGFSKRLHSLIEKGFRLVMLSHIRGAAPTQVNLPVLMPRRRHSGRGGVRVRSISTGREVNVVETLFKEGFFRSQKSFSEVLTELVRRGFSEVQVKKASGTIYSKVMSYVKSGRMTRDKPSGSKGFVFQARGT